MEFRKKRTKIDLKLYHRLYIYIYISLWKHGQKVIARRNLNFRAFNTTSVFSSSIVFLSKLMFQTINMEYPYIFSEKKNNGGIDALMKISKINSSL